MTTQRERPVSAVGVALQRSRQKHPPRLRMDGWRPYVGILGVLLGSIMGTLGSRTTSFGLTDLRGGRHADFDEGAWITTIFGIGQMLIGVASPYLGAVFGARRVLLAGTMLFFLASLLAPLAANFTCFLALLALAGIGSGPSFP